MNIKQLTAFREVMLSGSVSAAARSLHRTQPSISAMIANLEEEIGFPLFIRSGGRLHPVPEARYLLAETSDILGRLDTVKQTMQSTRDLEHGVIRIVAMPGPSVFLLPDLICRFAEGREQVEATLITRGSAKVQQLMAAQQYDVGLADIGAQEAVENALVNHDVMRFQCLCALHVDHPLAGRARISAQDLDGAPLATLYADHLTTLETKSVFEQAGAGFYVRFEAQYFVPLLRFVERGLAISIVDPLTAESYRLHRPDGGSITFRPFEPAVHLLASTMTPAHRPPSILATAFAVALKDELRRIQAVYAAD
jgi:DNA-binding transcriptional LysR family regulator